MLSPRPHGVSCRMRISALLGTAVGIDRIRLWYNDYDRKDLKMRKMAAGSFKIHCLALMDEVQAKRETVLITKHGRPVAKLVPADKNTDDIYNFLVGKGAIVGDIVSPAISHEDWGELK